MSDDLEYHDELARAGSRQFDEVGDALTRLSSDMRAELAGDSPWSQDKIGSSFEGQFGPHRTAALTNVENFAAKVESYGPAITKAADAVTTTDTPG